MQFFSMISDTLWIVYLKTEILFFRISTNQKLEAALAEQKQIFLIFGGFRWSYLMPKA